MLLREKVVHNSHTGSHWTSSLLFSLISELVPLYDVSRDVLDSTYSLTSQVIHQHLTIMSKLIAHRNA